MTPEYPQDGGSVCCCYNYGVVTRLQDRVVRRILLVIERVMSDACHAEPRRVFARWYPRERLTATIVISTIHC